jgi:hypothetical protein
MTLINPPPVVTQLRNQLLLCQSFIDVGIDTAKIHYPNASPSGDLADTMPFAVIAEQTQKRTKYAEGAIPLVSGTLGVTIYADETSFPTIGDLETFGRQVTLDLGSQFYGLHIRDSECGLASDLSPGQRAAEEDTPQAAYRTISLTFHYGLSR